MDKPMDVATLLKTLDQWGADQRYVFADFAAEAARVIRELQSKLVCAELNLSERDTTHDRDARAAMQVILALVWPRIDQAAETEDCNTDVQALELAMALRSARRVADLMQLARKRRAKE